MEEKSKGFGSRLGFILAAAGSAVGLGNIWRFPYLVGRHGGGAFVLVFLLSVLFLGIVVMIAEMYLGKRAQNSVVESYSKVNSSLKWLGILAVAVPFFITSYYSVIGGWATNYSVNYLLNAKFASADSAGYFTSFISDPVKPVFYTALCLSASILVVCGGVEKGIERASKILMPALFILLLVVVIKSLTLGNGVKEGLQFYIGKFDFKALGFDGVVAAMGQAFYSLSLGMGIMVSYGSYAGKKTNLAKSAVLVCLIDTLIAFLAGLAMFPAMFALGNGAELAQNAGASLLFIVLPQLFAVMKGGSVFGFMFFTLVTFASMTSIISLLEVVCQYAIKKHNLTRTKAITIFGVIIGLISVFVSQSQGAEPYTLFGYDLLTFFDEVTNTVLMPIIAFLGCIAVGWLIKPEVIKAEFAEMGATFKLQKVWLFLAKFVTPVLILFVFIMGIIGKWEAYTELNYGYVLLGSVILILFSIFMQIRINKQELLEKSEKSVEKE